MALTFDIETTYEPFKVVLMISKIYQKDYDLLLVWFEVNRIIKENEWFKHTFGFSLEVIQCN